jgi:hypothetical protein
MLRASEQYVRYYGSTAFLLSHWLHFSFLILCTVGSTSRTEDQPVTRLLSTLSTTKTQNKHTHRHSSLEWDSNPVFQHSSGAKAVSSLHRSATMISLLMHSYPEPDQSSPHYPVLILSTNLRLGLPSGLFPSGLPANNLYAFSHPPFVLHDLPHISTSHPLRLDLSDYTWRRTQIMNILVMHFPLSRHLIRLLSPNIPLSTLFSNTLSLCSFY